MEPHPLWEYPCFPLSDIHEIFSFELSNSNCEDTDKEIKMPFTANGLLNGVALWYSVDFDNNKSLEIDTGILEQTIPNKKLEWSKLYKQAVHILDKKYDINKTNRSHLYLSCIVNFKCKEGLFNVDFKINQN